jgi:hypothetical protein
MEAPVLSPRFRFSPAGGVTAFGFFVVNFIWNSGTQEKPLLLHSILFILY